jgi:deoxyribodipyrimidine photo-lyase
MTAIHPSAPVILWFRRDLRLNDNPALHAAAATGAPVIPLYILDDEAAGPWAPGAVARWWLHHSLSALGASLHTRGAALVLRRGPAAAVLSDLIHETGAAGLFWNHCYEPWAMARDEAIEADLSRRGLTVSTHNATQLIAPHIPRTKTGNPYKVFKPFWNALRAGPEPARPHPAPHALPAPATRPRSDRLADWSLLPTAPDWAGGLRETWIPGEAAARQRLDDWLTEALAAYETARNLPARDGSSRLSPHLHWGEIGPRQVWYAVRARTGHLDSAAEAFLRELGWRDFSTCLLHHFPDMPDQPLDRRFAQFPWLRDDSALRAWQRGRTGYPIVDAGMRQLWHTGWMHNRVRMIVGSFLVKDLMLPWQAGEAWFWDTLVDADLANNTVNWQWVAGCGADASPFFRIFNPVTQGEKFDPDGAYIRRYVPELARLPDKYIHHPWDAPAAVLSSAGVHLGRTYPQPMVDHAHARTRALAAFRATRAAGASEDHTFEFDQDPAPPARRANNRS